MARDDSRGNVARCSFCGKSEAMVHKLIEGPGVYICDECVSLCHDLITETQAPNIPHTAKKVSGDSALPKPEEIKAQLDEYVIGQDEAKKLFLLRFITIISVFTAMSALMTLNFKKAILCF